MLETESLFALFSIQDFEQNSFSPAFAHIRFFDSVKYFSYAVLTYLDSDFVNFGRLSDKFFQTFI